MALKRATIEEVLATFSSHLAEHYPSRDGFRRNFDLLLAKKRERPDASAYPDSLERNIVFLNDLVAEAESFVGRMLAAEADEGTKESEIVPALEAIEKRAHERNVQRHREAFVDGVSEDFRELRGDRAGGGKPYVEKLEFNYRYLMTYRIFLLEFISVLAAIRAEYSLAGTASEILAKVRGYLEITVHYYLGNVTVGGEGSADSFA